MYIEIDHERIDEDADTLLEFIDENTGAGDVREKIILLKACREELIERDSEERSDAEDTEDFDESYFV